MAHLYTRNTDIYGFVTQAYTCMYLYIVHNKGDPRFGFCYQYQVLLCLEIIVVLEIYFQPLLFHFHKLHVRYVNVYKSKENNHNSIFLMSFFFSCDIIIFLTK